MRREKLRETFRMLRKIGRRVLGLAADETGDVPGWVLITIMTAALVMAIWLIAGDALVQMVGDALRGVSFG